MMIYELFIRALRIENVEIENKTLLTSDDIYPY